MSPRGAVQCLLVQFGMTSMSLVDRTSGHTLVAKMMPCTSQYEEESQENRKQFTQGSKCCGPLGDRFVFPGLKSATAPWETDSNLPGLKSATAPWEELKTTGERLSFQSTLHFLQKNKNKHSTSCQGHLISRRTPRGEDAGR